jgi:hypothetical protein
MICSECPKLKRQNVYPAFSCSVDGREVIHMNTLLPNCPILLKPVEAAPPVDKKSIENRQMPTFSGDRE